MSWPVLPFGHHAGAEVISVLKSLYPRFQILDTSFPMLTFAWFHDDVVAVFHPDRVINLGERAFYGRFRQAGGHRPLLRLADIGPFSFSGSGQSGEPGKATVIACHAADCAWLPDVIADVAPATILLLSGADEDAATRQRLTQMGFAGRLTVRFDRAGATETFTLVTQGDFDQHAVECIRIATKAFAVDVRFDLFGTHAPALISVDLPPVGYRPPAVTISPKRLIHDGTGRSEGGDDYAWLWLGEERQVRVLLGHVPAHFRRVRVVVPNSVTAANLRTARLALNGRFVEPDIEVWRDGMGAVTAALRHEAGVDQVLGFSVAHAMALEAGAPIRAACIDRIEFQA